jgi:hypothetical protein
MRTRCAGAEIPLVHADSKAASTKAANTGAAVEGRVQSRSMSTG